MQLAATKRNHYEATVVLPIAGWQLGIRTNQQAVVAVDFIQAHDAMLTPPTRVAIAAADQLKHYLDNPNWLFSLPLQMDGTLFQKRVWEALQKLHPGETRSYGEFARPLNSAARAVGGACRANPIAIVVPCHRIVGARGIGGFSGETVGKQLEIKQWLLEHESKIRTIGN